MHLASFYNMLFASIKLRSSCLETKLVYLLAEYTYVYTVTQSCDVLSRFHKSMYEQDKDKDKHLRNEKNILKVLKIFVTKIKNLY